MRSSSLYARALALGPMKNFVYLLGAQGAEEVLVLDPAWDVPAIEAAVAEDGKRLVAALVSHSHNDHINGLPELLRRHDVPVYAQREEVAFSPELHRLGDAVRPLSGGDEVAVGPARFKALHTPGHTPGSQCLLCGEAVVTGDTLFIDACGRCDLRGGDPQAMHRTLTQVLMRLPDDTRVLPGHDYGPVPSATLQAQKQTNPYLRLPELVDFAAYRMRPR